MRDLIEYLAEILNINTDSNMVVLDMQQELRSIKNIEEYRLFIRSNLKHIDVEFMTGFQKFIKLTELYKKHELQNSLPHDTANMFTDLIISKVDECKTFVEHQLDVGKQAQFSMIKLEGASYFHEKELKALAEVSSDPATIIDLHRRGELKDVLTKVYMDKYIQKNSPAISHDPKVALPTVRKF